MITNDALRLLTRWVAGHVPVNADVSLDDSASGVSADVTGPLLANHFLHGRIYIAHEDGHICIDRFDELDIFRRGHTLHVSGRGMNCVIQKPRGSRSLPVAPWEMEHIASVRSLLHQEVRAVQ